MKKTLLLCFVTLLCVSSFNRVNALAWHDETHMAIAKAAGYPKWYNAAGPDIAKIKAGLVEERNHYSNNQGSGIVTPETVLAQVARYNNPDDDGGHLYGAIVASLRAYNQSKKDGKYAQYHLAYCGHYLGDLSQPLHNALPSGSKRINHGVNDGIVEDEVLQKLDRIGKNMYPLALRMDYLEEDLAKEIARIANVSRDLNDRLVKEDRNMSREEAYRQLGHSASLFRAVLNSLN
jgi:hypothetical protein